MRAGLDARAFGTAKLGAIGPKTAAALGSFGLRADAVAEEFIAEDLARAVLEHGVPKRVLLARALVARDVLPDLLRASGAQVDVVPVYETVATDAGEALREHFERGEIDVALFTSSSTVNAVVGTLGPRATELLSKVTVASIGPITSKTLSERGIRADVSATTYTVDGLLDALESHFSGLGAQVQNEG
jgi:uroporphyrinogen III methyltransferase/synthase